jgi:positive regulator of sigma E activity
MTQTAVIKNLLPDGKAEVVIKRGEACEACPSCSTCTTKREITLKALNLINAKIGETVIIKSKGLFKVEIIGAPD